MLRVLVAGCGYVGSALAEELVAAGHEVSALSRRPVAIGGVTGIAADLTDASTLVVPAVDVAVFAAAPDARDEDAYRALYIDGAKNLRNAIGSRPTLIFTSSTAVYGQDDGSEVDESSETIPSSYRGRVLLEAERCAEITLRLGGIYGPGRARAVELLRRGEARSSPGRFLNFIHRDDAVGALAHLTTLARPERVYLGVDREPVESETFYRWLAERMAVPPPPSEPSSVGRNKRCSSARLVRSGYVFRHPTYREGWGQLVPVGPAALVDPVRQLPPCPSSPNCVSSTAADARHHVPALAYRGTLEDARTEIVDTLRSLGGRIVVVEDSYVHAEFLSRIFRFVDDVECAFDAASRRVDFRSASRVGYSDLGANRRRVRKLLRRLTANEKKFAVLT